jgi:uncharacterized protein (TIGR03083 family)
MEQQLAALDASARHLADLVHGMDDEALTSPAYPSEWSIADVLSHLGSGAEIFRRRVDDAVAGRTTPDDFAQPIWDEWNAKPPRQQAEDLLVVDRDLIGRFGSLSDHERTELRIPFGPMELDVTAAVEMRLNEHVLHTWDVEVALHPDAALQPAGVELVVDSLEMIANWTAKPTGTDRTIAVRTTDPARAFVVTLTPDAASFAPGSDDAATEPDVRLPAEAFVRLVYGRLDPNHTPAEVAGDLDALAELRSVFPGP